KSGIEDSNAKSNASSTGSPRAPSSPSSEVRSVSSQQSIGLESSAFDKNSLGGVSRMYDVVQMAILCRQHRAILLVPVPKTAALYFPFAILKPGKQHKCFVMLVQSCFNYIFVR